jgi:hypothetical protein
MAVRREMLTAIALNEAHERQVEEVMETYVRGTRGVLQTASLLIRG